MGDESFPDKMVKNAWGEGVHPQQQQEFIVFIIFRLVSSYELQHCYEMYMGYGRFMSDEIDVIAQISCHISLVRSF